MSYALITGASKGIGKAIAEELAARRVNVLLIARSGFLLEEIANDLIAKFHIKAAYLTIDLADAGSPAAIATWVAENGYQVNILVNNAGYGLSGAFDRYTAKDHIEMMQVNMNVPVELCSFFITQLKQQPRSYILNIASSAAYQAVPGLTVYAASKAFMLNFSRGLAFELRKTTVSVTAVSPGATDTDFVNRAHIGTKALKAAEKLNMTPEQVAKIAVKAMFKRKTETITGMINKIGALLVWLLPKKLGEKIAAGLYGID